LWNIVAGFTESKPAAQGADMLGALGNPLGALAGLATGDLQYAEAGAALFDAAFGLYSVDACSLNGPLNALNSFAGLLSNAASVMESANPEDAKVVYAATDPTSITVTATPEPVQTIAVPTSDTLQDQGDGSGGDEGGESGGGGACDDID
jgi:hypothetical protein